MIYVADIGSCHGGSLSRAKHLMTIARKAGADSIKGQLLTDDQCSKGGNIFLPWDYVRPMKLHAMDRCTDLFFSVFSRDGIKLMAEEKFDTIKISYSHRYKLLDMALAENQFKLIYVSCDTNDTDILKINDLRLRRLYCVPEYPVRFEVDWVGPMETNRYHGISDHTLGCHQTIRAVRDCQIGIIEKHIRLNYPVGCPDEKFALDPAQWRSMVRSINKLIPHRADR